MSPCYIIDNGGRFSSHEIFFVDSEEPLDVMIALSKVVFGNSDATVLGATPHISWVGGHITMTLQGFLVSQGYHHYPHSLFFCSDTNPDVQGRVKELMQKNDPIPGKYSSW